MRRSIRALPRSNWSILLHNLSLAVGQMLEADTAFFWYKAFWFWSNSLNTGSHISVRTSKQITPCLLEAPGAWLLKTQLLLSQRESIYLAVAFFMPSLHAALMPFCFLFHMNSIQPPASKFSLLSNPPPTQHILKQLCRYPHFWGGDSYCFSYLFPKA